MLESITVPLDGTPRATRALRVAADVVRRTGGTLDLMVVTSPGLDLFEDERLLDEAASSVDVPIGSKQVVERDSVVEAICDLQRAQPRSLVCMSTHARTGVPELLLGGVAGEVLREMTQPVLLVGPHAETPPSLDTLLVCLDGSPAAEEVLPVAEAWASATGAKVWLVRVAPPTGTTAPEEANDLRRLVRDLEARTDLAVEWEVLHGRDVPKAILDQAGALPASVIAMATHGRSGAGGRLLGSVTMRVAHDARCPVLVARAGVATAP